MARLVALDTETTGLDPAVEDIFEIAVVDLDTGDEATWRIRPRDHVVVAMHAKAAEVNRFHERTADPDWRWDNPTVVAASLFGWLDGAHIVGAVPDFDARFLTEWHRRMGVQCPRWHYHLIDIETLAVGRLLWEPLTAQERTVLTELPWDSEELSRLIGVESPGGEVRHTALGDARWVARMWRALTGSVAA